MEKRTAIILASGVGKRMESDLPKVLHKVAGKEMVCRVFDLVESSDIDRKIIVVGHKADLVKGALGDRAEYVFQEFQLGTGHSIQTVKAELGSLSGTVLVLAGDTPLLQKKTITDIIKTHELGNAAVTVLAAEVENPFGYGRLVVDSNNYVQKIVEEKDATDIERKINLVNTGTYCFDGQKLFELIDLLDNNNAQSEYYLTDVIGLANVAGYKVLLSKLENPYEAAGVNTKAQLADVELMYNKYIKGE